MTNDHGLRVRFLSYGGVITEIVVPDRTGGLDNIGLGLRTLREYETLSAHYGAITGRYANRIGGAQFTLNGQTYHLIANNGANTLHGGPNALDKQVWDGSIRAGGGRASPRRSAMSVRTVIRTSRGTLTTHVTYTLTNDNALRIDYLASTDKDKVINFTNHSYFNLAGNGSGYVADQMMTIMADQVTPPMPDQMPTGELAPVAGTPSISGRRRPSASCCSARSSSSFTAHGYDHNYVLNQRPGEEHEVARAAHRSGQRPGDDCSPPSRGAGLFVQRSEWRWSAPRAPRIARRMGSRWKPSISPTVPNKPNFPSTELAAGAGFSVGDDLPLRDGCAFNAAAARFGLRRASAITAASTTKGPHRC